jgi:hypothetical protein
MSFLLFRPTIKNKKKNPSVLDYLLAVAAIVIIGMWMIMYPDYALNKI